MGSTMELLNGQWIKAVLNYDGAGVERIEATMEKIKILPSKPCKWENTNTCRGCMAPEAGKCPSIAVDVAA